jgi:hypothetical protein
MYLYSDLKQTELIEENKSRLKEFNKNNKISSIFNDINLEKNIDNIKESLSKKNNFFDLYSKKEKQIKEHIRAYNIKSLEKKENENKLNKQNNINKILNDIKIESDCDSNNNSNLNSNSNSNRKSYLNKNEKIANETFLTACKNLNLEENMNNSSIRKIYINTEEKENIGIIYDNDHEK